MTPPLTFPQFDPHPVSNSLRESITYAANSTLICRTPDELAGRVVVARESEWGVGMGSRNGESEWGVGNYCWRA